MPEVTVPPASATTDRFAQLVRDSVSSGEIAGAIAAVETAQTVRIDAFGFRDQASASPMEVDTIMRIGSMAKIFTVAAALVLLEDKKFRLDEPIAKWMPELADRRVLRTPGSEVDDTVPAEREITMFDVLTFQLGIGIYVAQQDSPLLRAMYAAGVGPIHELVPFSPDEYISRLGSLPLAHQPGETFMYHTGEDVLRVLVARISGQSLGEVLFDRVFEPLGMLDSGLSVPEAKRHRFSTCYLPRADPAEPLPVWDGPSDRFTEDPIFPTSAVSTAHDFLTFANMLLGDGEVRGRRILTPESVALMTTDHLSEEQKRRSPAPDGWWQTRGWGMGATVYACSVPQGPNAGSYSWYGGYGGHFIVDKKRGSAVLLLIPRLVQGAAETTLGYEFELNTYRDLLSAQTV